MNPAVLLVILIVVGGLLAVFFIYGLPWIQDQLNPPVPTTSPPPPTTTPAAAAASTSTTGDTPVGLVAGTIPTGSSTGSSSNAPITTSPGGGYPMGNGTLTVGATCSYDMTNKTFFPKKDDNAIIYIVDDNQNCVINTCQHSYKIDTYGMKCIPKTADELQNEIGSSGGAVDCSDAFHAAPLKTCLGGGEAGIGWEWDESAKTYCTNKVGKYEVTVENPDFLDKYALDPLNRYYKTTIKSGGIGTVGIKGLWPSYYENADLNFTVTAFDKDNAQLAGPILIPVQKGSETKACSDVGTNVLQAGKWNDLMNLINVNMINRGGGGESGWAINSGGLNSKSIHDNGRRELYNSSEGDYVPYKGNLVFYCNAPLAGYQDYNDDNTWDEMIKNKAAANDYQYHISHQCLSADAKAENDFGPGW